MRRGEPYFNIPCKWWRRQSTQAALGGNSTVRCDLQLLNCGQQAADIRDTCDVCSPGPTGSKPSVNTSSYQTLVSRCMSPCPYSSLSIPFNRHVCMHGQVPGHLEGDWHCLCNANFRLIKGALKELETLCCVAEGAGTVSAGRWVIAVVAELGMLECLSYPNSIMTTQ